MGCYGLWSRQCVWTFQFEPLTLTCNTDSRRTRGRGTRRSPAERSWRRAEWTSRCHYSRELEGYCRRETHSEARVEQAHEDAVFLVGNDDGDALRGVD